MNTSAVANTVEEEIWKCYRGGGWLGFYGISTFVVYLTPNTF